MGRGQVIDLTRCKYGIYCDPDYGPEYDCGVIDCPLHRFEEYTRWIDEVVTSPSGTCREHVHVMKIVFPELEIVRGFYQCGLEPKRPHWWLIDPWNRIIDPTSDQFASKGSGIYYPNPLDEMTEERSLRLLRLMSIHR